MFLCSDFFRVINLVLEQLPFMTNVVMKDFDFVMNLESFPSELQTRKVCFFASESQKKYLFFVVKMCFQCKFKKRKYNLYQ